MKVILVLEEMPEMKTMNDSLNPHTTSDVQLDSPSTFFLPFFLHQKSFKGNFNTMHLILLRLLCAIEKVTMREKGYS